MKAPDLGSEKVFRTVLKLVLPAMAAQFINVLYSIVDRLYVGNIAGIGDDALAAVGVCAPIATLISSFSFLVGIGGAPLFAMAMGEKREDQAKKILSNALYALTAVAVLVSVLVIALERPLLMTFGASQTTYVYARRYLLIYAAGSVFAILTMGLNQYITAQGYSGIAMLITLTGAALNIALDPLFIFVFHLDTAGAALATILSQFFSCLLAVLFLCRKKAPIRLGFSRFDAKLIGRIAKLGFAPFLIAATDSLIIIATNAVLQARGGESGDFWITVSTIVQAFFQLVTLPMMGISTGSQPVLSYNYGARNIALIKRAEKYILSLCLAFTAFMTAVSFLCAGPFVSLFTSTPEVAEKSVWGIRVFMIGAIPLALPYAFVDGLTALGYPHYAIIVSLTRKVAVYLGCTFLFPALWGVQAAFYAEPAADIAGAILAVIVFAVAFPRILKKRQTAGSLFAQAEPENAQK